jgi:Domain of unknown function (DUF4252)
LMLCVIPVTAQDITEDPGYVDFSGVVDGLGAEADKEVNIHGPMLRLVIAAARKDDPELAELLTTVTGIFVRGYVLSSLDFDSVIREGKILGDDLRTSGWEVFLKVNDADENVQMYVRINGPDIAGVVLVSSNQNTDETVFLNIVGNIDPEQLSRIGDKFSVGGL